MGDSPFKISPKRGPFQYHVWLELPFPLAVEVNEDFIGEYKTFATRFKIKIISNAYKIVSSSMWQQSREVKEWANRVQAGANETPPMTGWVYEYVTSKKVYDFVKELEINENSRYVHVEEIPAVVHVSTLVPEKVVPQKDFHSYDLSPQIGFVSEEILPALRKIIDVYRVAAFPFMRYAISPVSEALIDRAYIQFTDRDDQKVGSYFYGFDVKSPHFMGIMPNIQVRFEKYFHQVSTIHAEDQMASAYYLFRMRRWTEALTIASSVVDNLVKELVLQIASSEVEGEALWLTYGRRYKELFNEVFPKFGLLKLSSTNKQLWDNFVQAKKRRGSKVHGNYSDSFDKKEQTLTKQDLAAFHDVSSWLANQMGENWALDSVDEEDNKLDPFP